MTLRKRNTELWWMRGMEASQMGSQARDSCSIEAEVCARSTHECAPGRKPPLERMHNSPNPHATLHQTNPTTTVTRKLPSAPLVDASDPRVAPLDATLPVQPSTPSSSLSLSLGSEPMLLIYSSDRRAELFQPHDWERVKLSGAEQNRMRVVPRAEAQEMEK